MATTLGSATARSVSTTTTLGSATTRSISTELLRSAHSFDNGTAPVALGTDGVSSTRRTAARTAGTMLTTSATQRNIRVSAGTATIRLAASTPATGAVRTDTGTAHAALSATAVSHTTRPLAPSALGARLTATGIAVTARRASDGATVIITATGNGIHRGLPRDLTLTVDLSADRFLADVDAGRWQVTLNSDRYIATLEVTVPRLIRASIGDTAYVTVTVKERFGADIATASFQMSLGTIDAPGTWRNADVSERIEVGKQRVKLLVGAGAYTPGSLGKFFPWVRIADNPETESLHTGDSVTIA